MIINGNALIELAPINGMISKKRREHGVSYGRSEAGYDIRVKQDIWFGKPMGAMVAVDGVFPEGNFALASAYYDGKYQNQADMPVTAHLEDA